MKLRLEKTYQVFEDLPSEQFQAFMEDIRVRGVLVPIEVDEEGLVLDGHQRARAVLALEKQGHRIDYRVNIRPGLSEDDKFAHGVSMNMQRRQLDGAQKRELAETLKRRFAWSNVKIAALLAVAPSTVLRWLDGIDGLPEHVMGEDGRVYRSQTWGGVSAGERDVAAALQAALTVGGREKTIDVRRALVLARQAKLEAPYIEYAPDHPLRPEDPAFGLELRLGGVGDAYHDLPGDSVDLILTDPPYPHEFLPAWSDLGALAQRVLKPGRLLVAYCGHRWLDECFDRLRNEGLRYAWLGGLFFGGSGPSVHDRHMFSAWRPILMMSKGEWIPHRWAKDAWFGEGAEKDLHPWQQSLGTFLELVESFTDAGDLVVDPFLGSGTTAVAAVRLSRRFVGGDIAPGTLQAARERLGY